MFFLLLFRLPQVKPPCRTACVCALLTAAQPCVQAAGLRVAQPLAVPCCGKERNSLQLPSPHLVLVPLLRSTHGLCSHLASLPLHCSP